MGVNCLKPMQNWKTICKGILLIKLLKMAYIFVNKMHYIYTMGHCEEKIVSEYICLLTFKSNEGCGQKGSRQVWNPRDAQ